MASTLTLHSTVARADDQVFCELDGEMVLMSISNGEYYRLDDVGSRIWALLDEPSQVGALCDRLAEEYAIDRTTCEADVLAFLTDLQEGRLISVSA